MVLAIDNVYHEHNASALLRTAEGLGFGKVWIIENKNRFSPVKGIALGVTKWLDIKRFKNEKEFLEEVAKNRYKLAVTVMPDHPSAIPITEFSLKEPIVLTVGSEKEGVSRELIEKADLLLTIPMLGLVESFNVSVATAIFLWELRKKLEVSNIKWQLSYREKILLLYQWLKRTVKNSAELEQRL